MHATTANGFSGDFWIGMKVSQSESSAVVPEWWLDGQTAVKYENWASGMPAYKGDKWEGDCVCMYGLANTKAGFRIDDSSAVPYWPTLSQPRESQARFDWSRGAPSQHQFENSTKNVGKWANKKCIAIDKRGVCKKKADYDPDAPTPPPIIIHPNEELNEEKCGSNDWLFISETKKCYHFTRQRYTNARHRKFCEDIGGKGASLNSPVENQQLQAFLTMDPV